VHVHYSITTVLLHPYEDSHTAVKRLDTSPLLQADPTQVTALQKRTWVSSDWLPMYGHSGCFTPSGVGGRASWMTVEALCTEVGDTDTVCQTW
jgi:hypothetical protein